MRPKALSAWARACSVALLALSGLRPLPTPAQAASLGDGRAMVVEYDLSFKPLCRYAGLQWPVDVTPLSDGTILVADQGALAVLLLDAGGGLLWREQLAPHPIRARPRPGGGFLITSIGEVVAVGADRTLDWRLRVEKIGAAAPMPNGNVLVTTADPTRWLVEMAPDGTVVWQMEAPPIGAESRRLPYLWALDLGPGGRIFTTDFDGLAPWLFTPDRREIRRLDGARAVRDARIGPGGELITVSPEEFQVRLDLSDGTTRSFTTSTRPLCANLSPRGTLIVGLEGEERMLNASRERSRERPAEPWQRRGLPLPMLAVAFSLASGAALRWRELRARVRPSSAEHVPPDPEGQPTPITRRRIILGLFWATALAASCFLAWRGALSIEALGYTVRSWQLAAGSVLGGVSLWRLGALTDSLATFTSFVPSRWNRPPRRADRLRTTILVLLALSSLCICVGLMRRAPAEQAAAVACWMAAQIWILAAAFPALRRAASDRTPRIVWAVLFVVLGAAAVTRFWQIGYYPDFVHHDHALFGEEVLRVARGDWQPFFDRVYSVGRPWLVPTALGLRLFGTEYWVLRLTGALSGLGVVAGTYLLGAELFNRRVGLIGAWLATVNHLLLLYSRQPYVLDPAAPFVLALYCAAAGLRRGSRFHWCLAGILTSWALLGYYVSVTYVPVLVAAFLYLACFHPRSFWRARSGILWFMAGVAIVYLPMLLHAADSVITLRAQSTVALLAPDGSIRWDADLWRRQLSGSFGYLFKPYPDAPWGVGTGQSICMTYGSCLFGVGLVFLILRWRAPASFVLVAWMLVSIFLGSTALHSPPGGYHLLTAIVPIMLTSAVALDRALAVADRWQAVWRALPVLAALALIARIGVTNTDAVWKSVRRLPPAADGRPVFRADASVMAARFIRDHPTYRHFLVRSRNDPSSRDATFRFFAGDSDLSDLSGDLAEALPVDPVEPAAGATFIFLSSRAGDRDSLLALYPSARAEEVLYGPYQAESLWMLLVDAKAVREAAGSTFRSAARGSPDG
jgi:4-amino-4-deoxy-L-arabinose transferase-like glycosyltransferase